MFTFLLIFIIFLIILNVTIRKNDSRQTKREEDFWGQERAANFARRKDISNLEYLTIPAEKIPHNLHTEAEEILVNLSNCKMLNLAGITNTELKLTYGAANLEELSEYDDNTKHLYNCNQHEKNHVGIANDALNQYSQKSEALVFGRI